MLDTIRNGGIGTPVILGLRYPKFQGGTNGVGGGAWQDVACPTCLTSPSSCPP